MDRWVNANTTVRVIAVLLAGSLAVSSCTEPTKADSSTTQAASASWSTDEFEDLVEHCDRLYDEPSSVVEVDCRVVVRQNLDELGCPVDGTYEVIEETRRLIGLDIQFDNEAHTEAEVADWVLQMQSELDNAYARAGCRERLNLNW